MGISIMFPLHLLKTSITSIHFSYSPVGKIAEKAV